MTPLAVLLRKSREQETRETTGSSCFVFFFVGQSNPNRGEDDFLMYQPKNLQEETRGKKKRRRRAMHFGLDMFKWSV